MKKLAKEQKRFCKYCGTEMEITIESAEGWSPAWSFYYTYSKYNEKTGEQNLMKVFTCPKGWYKSFFGGKQYDYSHSKTGIKHNF